MMINMSLIPAGDIGIDADGHLVFDPVGGMAFEDMLRLRDMFPNTAGNVAIGIDDRQIQLMLASGQIDYVIPYHVSGLNKKMRKYMDIQAWQEYTSSQNEKGNKRGKKGKAPALKEWFNEAEGVKAKDGYEYMRQASEKYLQLCYERNLAPKFPQYLNKNADGSYSLKEEYANYWKLLIDRKMVNQKTGRVIAQKAVLPNFDSDFILGNEAKGITGILDQALNDPAVQDVVTAENMVFEKFSNWSSDINNADAEAIEEAKRVRDLAARVAVQKTVEAGGMKTHYSLERVDGIEFVRAEPTLFMNEDGSMKSESEIFDSLVGKVFRFPDGDVEIVRSLPGKNMRDELFRRFPSQSNLRGVKKPSRLNAAVNRNIEELIENSDAVSLNDPDVGGRHAKQGIVSFDTRSVNFYDGYRAYAVEFSIGVLNDGRKVAYAKRDYTYNKALTEKIRANDAKKQTVEKAVRATGKEAVAPDVQLSQLSSSEPNQLSANENKIAQAEQTVNTPFALDSVGRELSEGQREYFKASVVRDEQGRLKLMYHGTSSGGFTIFDTFGGNHGLFGIGSYFTDSKTVAEGYTKKGKGKNQQIYPCYLNITNPIDMDAVGNRAQWQEAFPDATLPETGTNEEFYRAVEDYFVDEMYPKWEAADAIRGGLEGMGYDGITHIGGGRTRMDSEQHRVYIAFFEEQIKSVDNLKPTTDADIRFSLDKSGAKNKGHYDYSKSFAEQIDDYKAGKFPQRDTFVLGGTPKVLQKIGLSSLPMVMDQEHVNRALFGDESDNHFLGDAKLKNLPSLIADPIAIIGSATHPNDSIMVITKEKVNGHQLAVPVQIDVDGIANVEIFDSNPAASAQGRPNAISKLLREAIKTEARGKEAGIYYWDKKEALAMVDAELQLLGRHIVNGYIHNIADAKSPVNIKYLAQTETRQFKRWFGRSVVRNADGTPTILYHGTDANFTVFERGDIGYHVGTKAQAEDRIAGVEGGHIMELYASIQNPLHAAFDFGDWHGQNVAQMLMETEQFEDFDNRAEIEARLSEIAQMDNQQEADTAMRAYLQSLGYDGIVYENNWEGAGDSFIVFESSQLKSATDNIGLFDRQNPDIRYSVDHDLLRETVEAIDKTALEENLEKLEKVHNLKGAGLWLLEPSRIFDAVAGGNKVLRNTLHEIFEKPHSDATGRFAENQRKMAARVEQIAVDAGAVSIDRKGRKTFHENVSAAIQNYGEGYQMKECKVEAWVVSQYEVHVVAKNKKTGDIHMNKDFTLKELRRNFGYENGTRIWEKAFSKKTENYRTVTNGMGLPGDTNIKKEGVKVEAYVEGDGLQVIATKENGEQVFSGKMNLAELRKAFGVKAADEIWKAAAENESPLTPDIVYDFHDGREVVAHVAGRTPHGMRGLKFTACKWRGAGKDNSM